MARFTIKQRKFIDYYLITLNGVESARRAGYKGDYSTLGVVAHENLKKPKIRREIERRLSGLAMSADETLHRLGEQARGSLEHFIRFEEDGTFWVDLDKARAAGMLHLAKEVRQEKKVYTYDDASTETTYKTTVKIHDSQSALDKLMRYHGLYDDKVRLVTWKDKVIEALRAGRVEPEQVKERLGDALARELFKEAGVDAGS